MLAHAPADDSVFAACLRLFYRYPLAIRRHYAEHRYGSLVLMDRGTGGARHYVLIMEWDDLFVIRPWDRRDGARVPIRRGEPVSDGVRRVIESAVPVPRDGTLLGWTAGHKVEALVAAHGRLTEPWDDASAVPGVTVMPVAGSQPVGWPPFAARPLDGGRLWEHLARGHLADLTPLVSRHPGYVFWVPGSDGRSGGWTGARVVVTERLNTSELWLPAGVYADRQVHSEGAPRRTASQLLALPGVVDLARGQPHLLRLAGCGPSR